MGTVTVKTTVLSVVGSTCSRRLSDGSRKLATPPDCRRLSDGSRRLTTPGVKADFTYTSPQQVAKPSNSDFKTNLNAALKAASLPEVKGVSVSDPLALGESCKIASTAMGAKS